MLFAWYSPQPISFFLQSQPTANPTPQPTPLPTVELDQVSALAIDTSYTQVSDVPQIPHHLDFDNHTANVSSNQDPYSITDHCQSYWLSHEIAYRPGKRGSLGDSQVKSKYEMVAH